MRTTLDIDDRLLSAARRRAAKDGTTLTAFVEAALAAALSPRPSGAKAYRFEWKTHKGRLQPGIDLSDRDSLFDAMEGRR